MANSSSPASTPESPDQIWAGDLFGRRKEAELLIGYVDSVGRRPSLQEDHRGFTIAVDADYGIGKSYFLRRFARHLAATHPVAFVDAWADDLADEPLTAIAATLKRALAPFASNSVEVQNKWESVAEKTGEVAKIVAKGLLKKGLGLIITSSAVEAIDELISVSKEDIEKLEGEISETAKSTIDGVADSISKVPPKKLMAAKIADFESGQSAIQEMKDSLGNLVASLSKKGHSKPIVIVIDELDRCRPTYAVKLLEETKHLFDVPGIVFIFGMNSAQLSKSVTGAYGPDFDGQSYLRRFINRQYSLSFPDTEPLVSFLIKERGIKHQKLMFLPVTERGRRNENLSPASMIARYMKAYGMTARDAFQVVDVIHTSAAVTGDAPLFMPLLLPMIIGQVQGLKDGDIPNFRYKPEWHYTYYDALAENGQFIEAEVEDIVVQSRERSRWSRKQLSESANNQDNLSYLIMEFFDQSRSGVVDASPSNYPSLLQHLDRFSEVTVDL